MTLYQFLNFFLMYLQSSSKYMRQDYNFHLKYSLSPFQCWIGLTFTVLHAKSHKADLKTEERGFRIILPSIKVNSFILAHPICKEHVLFSQSQNTMNKIVWNSPWKIEKGRLTMPENLNFLNNAYCGTRMIKICLSVVSICNSSLIE